MSYEKLNLSNGTVLDQSHLAHIEEGIENAVCYDSAQPDLTEEQKAQARENIGAVAETTFSLGSYFGGKNLVLFLSGKSVVDTVDLPVLTYNKLELLNELEKAQARKNIGAASVDEVLVLGEQTLTEAQKAQARENIGATSVEEVLAALPVYNGEVEAV